MPRHLSNPAGFSVVALHVSGKAFALIVKIAQTALISGKKLGMGQRLCDGGEYASTTTQCEQCPQQHTHTIHYPKWITGYPCSHGGTPYHVNVPVSTVVVLLCPPVSSFIPHHQPISCMPTTGRTCDG